MAEDKGKGEGSLENRYHISVGETLWDIAKRELPEMKPKDAVVEIFRLNWEPLARKFWVPVGTDLKLPPKSE